MSSRMSLKSPICRVLAARSGCVVEAKILIKIYKYGEQNYAVFKVESERAFPLLPVLLLSAYCCRCYCCCCCRRCCSVCLCWCWCCRFLLILLILLIVLLLLPLRDEPSNTTANRMDGRGRTERAQALFGQQQMLGKRQHSHRRGITKHSLAREHRTINEKERHTRRHRKRQWAN